MDKYYKILGVEEPASKALIKMAYAYALSHAREKQIEDSKILEIHLAYQVLMKYRQGFGKWKKSADNQKLQQDIEETKKQLVNGRIEAPVYSSTFGLEIGFAVRTMLLGIFPILLTIFAEMFINFLLFSKDIRDFLASLIFYFAVINLIFNWIESFYSYLLIMAAFGMVFWRLRAFEKKIIKAINEHLNLIPSQ